MAYSFGFGPIGDCFMYCENCSCSERCFFLCWEYYVMKMVLLLGYCTWHVWFFVPDDNGLAFVHHNMWWRWYCCDIVHDMTGVIFCAWGMMVWPLFIIICDEEGMSLLLRTVVRSGCHLDTHTRGYDWPTVQFLARVIPCGAGYSGGYPQLNSVKKLNSAAPIRAWWYCTWHDRCDFLRLTNDGLAFVHQTQRCVMISPRALLSL